MGWHWAGDRWDRALRGARWRQGRTRDQGGRAPHRQRSPRVPPSGADEKRLARVPGSTASPSSGWRSMASTAASRTRKCWLRASSDHATRLAFTSCPRSSAAKRACSPASPSPRSHDRSTSESHAARASFTAAAQRIADARRTSVAEAPGEVRRRMVAAPERRLRVLFARLVAHGLQCRKKDAETVGREGFDSIGNQGRKGFREGVVPGLPQTRQATGSLRAFGRREGVGPEDARQVRRGVGIARTPERADREDARRPGPSEGRPGRYQDLPGQVVGGAAGAVGGRRRWVVIGQAVDATERVQRGVDGQRPLASLEQRRRRFEGGRPVLGCEVTQRIRRRFFWSPRPRPSVVATPAAFAPPDRRRNARAPARSRLGRRARLPVLRDRAMQAARQEPERGHLRAPCTPRPVRSPPRRLPLRRRRRGRGVRGRRRRPRCARGRVRRGGGWPDRGFAAHPWGCCWRGEDLRPWRPRAHRPRRPHSQPVSHPVRLVARVWSRRLGKEG